MNKRNNDISHVCGGAWESAMLYDLSEQVAHCYRRAAECKERAEQSDDPGYKEFYVERENAWLKLARSFEMSERISRVLNERQRQRLRKWPAARALADVPKCPACGIETGLHLVEPVFVQAAEMMFERAFFLCPNCGCVANNFCD
jgi:hypothetical protein